MNDSYETAYNRICRFWSLKSTQEQGFADIAFVNKRNGNIGHLFIDAVSNSTEIIVRHRMEVMYNYRGYVRRIQTHFNEYNNVQRRFYAINSNAFQYWVVRYMDFCRSVEINEDVLRDEISHVYTTERMYQMTNGDYYDPHMLPIEQKYRELLNIA
jgi:hypothetical protein